MGDSKIGDIGNWESKTNFECWKLNYGNTGSGRNYSTCEIPLLAPGIRTFPRAPSTDVFNRLQSKMELGQLKTVGVLKLENWEVGKMNNWTK